MQQTNPASSPFRIDLSADQLTATVVIDAGATVTAADVLAGVRAHGFKQVRESELSAALQGRGTAALQFMVAHGVAPVDERSGKIDYRLPLAQAGGVSINRVEAGQVIAKLGPGTGGVAGQDVFGEPIPPKPAASPIALGAGVTLTKGEILTTMRGSLRSSDGKLSIAAVLDVTDDSSQPIEFAGDVQIKNGIRDGRRVRVEGSVVVGGGIEAADVGVVGAMQVKGGIIGKGRARCSTTGDLWCRFINAATLNVSGDLHVQGEVAQANIICARAVAIAHGRIYGGRIVANSGVACDELGNQQGTATIIEVGTDLTLAALSSEMTTEIQTRRTRAREVRSKIEPLMKHLKKLTHQQREKATELLAEADELEAEADTLAEKLGRLTAEMRASEKAEVVVRDVVHVGSIIRIGSLETLVKTAFKGPLTFTTQKIGGVTAIVLIDGGSKSATALPSYPIKLGQPADPRSAAKAA